MNISENLIKNYAEKRDLPALDATSKLGVYLRFGTISIREVTRIALSLSEVFLNELIWRNFFSQILRHFPQVENKAFKSKYDFIQWRNNEKEFEAWCRGETGYPMVDAGMRELNETGFMHNRVRMVTASFLTKHLLIDWRWGEAYFAEKLLDFDLASNNGNWQWAAGCGCDAAPYFRVFNPAEQQKKFDPQAKYILKWVPEYGTVKYPQPIVEHAFARERVLRVYKSALG
jgi:deoxyribodipyrimidine photo-lyase